MKENEKKTAVFIERTEFTSEDSVPISMWATLSANERESYLGFSKGSGSFRPNPAGCFSASSDVIKWSSASTLP